MNTPKFDQTEYLQQHIPYRITSVIGLRRGLDLVHTWKGGQNARLLVTLNDKPVVQGNGAALTNPMIEMGLLSVRVMFNFLGIGVSKNGRLQEYNGQDGDVMLKHFVTRDGEFLSSIKPNEAGAFLHRLWPNIPHADIERAIEVTIAHANKAVAHLTVGPVREEDCDLKYRLASDSLPPLIDEFLYAKVGIAAPNWSEKMRRVRRES
jgi:hypothetical protein